MSRTLELTHLSRDPAWIAAADAAGIERIGIDIERLGKAERQSTVANARISEHELKDLRTVSRHVRRAKPFARLNRPHAGSADEIDEAIAHGAKSLMLPGFDTAAEVESFVRHIDGRCEVILLIETRMAVETLERILAVAGISQVMAGLNDLSLQYGLAGPMHMAVSDTLDRIAERVHTAGLPFGFGGVARPERHDLPANPDLLLARYAQLDARLTWVSRSFTNDGLEPKDFANAVARLHTRHAHWCQCDAQTRAEAVDTLRTHLSASRPS